MCRSCYKKLPNYFHKGLWHFNSYQQCMKVPVTPHPHHIWWFLFSSFWIVAIPVGMQCDISLRVSNCNYFLKADEVKPGFMYVFAFLYLLMSSFLFLIFLLLISRNSLYILCTGSVSDIRIGEYMYCDYSLPVFHLPSRSSTKSLERSG